MAEPNSDSGQDIESWEHDLRNAGWVTPTKLHTLWQAPNGVLYLGPYGAWKAMKQAAAVRAEGGE